MQLLQAVLVVAVSACFVGLSVGLPTAVDEGLQALADVDLDLKAFYKSMRSHEFTEAARIYDSLRKNVEKLMSEKSNVSGLRSKLGDENERFVRLLEIQMLETLDKVRTVIDIGDLKGY